jgi:hypothetical protein
MAKGNPTPELWDPVTIKADALYQASFSTLAVWLKRSREDWYLASQRPEKETEPAPLREVKVAKLRQDLSFSRWVVGQDVSAVQFVPAMPDRSMIVRPAVPLKVPTGKDALFFLSIPVWVRVIAQPPDGIRLCELPTLILSNTWFGEPTSGELCYALRTRAMRSLGEIAKRPYTAVCPVSIRNRAPKELNFERLCVRVEHLNVYKGRERLWTNELEVRFQGDEHSSQVTIAEGAPRFAEDLKKVCVARQPVEKTLLKQSFSFLRSLTGF